MRGRVPWGLLALLFVAVPLLEIYLVIQAGQAIGVGWTILILVLDSVLGAALLKREGAQAWAALRDSLASYRMPARELADGVLVLVGGTLLLTPGFVTDALGFFFILPLTRPLARRTLTAFITRRFLGPAGPSETAHRERRRSGGPGRTTGTASPGAGGSRTRPGQPGPTQSGPGQSGPTQSGPGQSGSRGRQSPGPETVRGEVVD